MRVSFFDTSLGRGILSCFHNHKEKGTEAAAVIISDESVQGRGQSGTCWRNVSVDGPACHTDGQRASSSQGAPGGVPSGVLGSR